MRIRKSLATIGAAGMLAAGSVGLATPAQAAPVFTGGVVNVTIVDLLDANNNQVIAQVPIGVAAAVCDINVAVLAALEGDNTTCEATQSSLADAMQQRGRGANAG